MRDEEFQEEKRVRKQIKKPKTKIRTKGALIKGVSRMLPSEVIKSNIFAEHLPQLMKRYAGVYLLYRKQKVHYVGLMKDLLGRLKNHLSDKHKGKWDQFTVFRIQKVRHLKDLETLLQYVTLPPRNVVEGRVPKDADINRILIDVLKIHKGVIRGLKATIRKR